MYLVFKEIIFQCSKLCARISMHLLNGSGSQILMTVMKIFGYECAVVIAALLSTTYEKIIYMCAVRKFTQGKYYALVHNLCIEIKA